MLSAVVPNTIQASWLRAVTALNDPKTDDIDAIVNSIGTPQKLTSELLSKFFTVDGVCPLHLRKNETNLNELVGIINWDGYEFDKGQKIGDGLPSAEIYFDNSNPETPPVIKRIITTYRGQAPQEYTPEKPEFQKGLTEAACAGFVYGQTVYHLLMGHVLPMAHRDLMMLYLTPEDTLGKLLIPHTHQLRSITNTFGKTAISGDSGILGSSCLSGDGINQVMEDAAGAIDPFTWHARTPRSYNRLGKLMEQHEKVIRQSVHEYFDAHWHELVKNWGVAHTFFDALHKHSPLYKPFQNVSNLNAWVDNRDIANSEPENYPAREALEGKEEVQSIRRIARNSVKPEELDRELIENYCTWFIATVTGWHSFIHLSQFPYAKDPRSFPIRLGNYGVGPHYGLTKETTLAQLQIGNTLEDFKFESYSVIDNPNKDIVGYIQNAVRINAKAYQALNFNPRNIMLSTVI